MDGVFTKVNESEYLELSTPEGLNELKESMANGLQGGKRRRAAPKKTSKKSSKKGSKKLSGGKRRKSSKKASKKTSKKGSKKLSGGKRRKSSKKASKKASKKGSKKQTEEQLGGKRKRASKKASKKTSKKGSKKGGKREMPAAAKIFGELVKVIRDDEDVPINFKTALSVAKLYKDEMAADNKNMSPMDVTKKAIKEYPGESAANKKKYLAKAEKNIADKSAAKKAAKA
jgi:hypothetical protein